MLTKEKLGKLFTRLARIFPGIPSYQDREALREQDKAVRDLLAKRLTHAAEDLSEAANSLLSSGGLALLGAMDTKRRKLHRLADTLRFSAYGYTGLFAANAVDEERLAQVWEFDLELEETVAGVERAVEGMKESASTGFDLDAAKSLDDAFNLLESRLKEREVLLREQA